MPLTYLIPTAKEMTIPEAVLPHQLSEKSKQILKIMHSLSIEELAKSYNISVTAAQKEKGRWQAIIEQTPPTYPATQLFNGLMYRYINKDLITKNSKVYITSSFYGIIQALHPIAEHRHDFHTKISIANQNLSQFWREDYDTFANQQETIVSLLSSEFSDVFSKPIREQFVSLAFMEDKNGQLKTHSTISKKARGAFLSAALNAEAKTISDLIQLTFDNFKYNKDLSTDKKLVFIKQV